MLCSASALLSPVLTPGTLRIQHHHQWLMITYRLACCVDLVVLILPVTSPAATSGLRQSDSSSSNNNKNNSNPCEHPGTSSDTSSLGCCRFPYMHTVLHTELPT
eukprot:3782700-Rhodomonas_salina.1